MESPKIRLAKSNEKHVEIRVNESVFRKLKYNGGIGGGHLTGAEAERLLLDGPSDFLKEAMLMTISQKKRPVHKPLSIVKDENLKKECELLADNYRKGSIKGVGPIEFTLGQIQMLCGTLRHIMKIESQEEFVRFIHRLRAEKHNIKTTSDFQRILQEHIDSEVERNEG